MKNKQTLIAGAVLVVLALIYWLTQTGTLDTKSIDADVFKVKSGDITTVTVKTGESVLTFQKEGASWMLDDYLVDSSRMTGFLDEITALKADRIISKNPENYPKYEVDEQGTAIGLMDSKGKTLLNLIIGTQGANYMETFVKRVDKAPIYAVKSNLLRFKDMKYRDFWDKSITDLKVDELKTVTFAGTYNYVLQREGPVWSMNGEQVDFEKVQNLLKPLENLRASNFIEAIGEDKELYQTIELELESGEMAELHFYLKDEKASVLLLDSSTRSKKFEYPKSGLSRYGKSLEDLQADPEA